MRFPSLIFLFFVLFFVSRPLLAQDVTTVTANSDDISDNLDLEAVASVFGASEDLEDFEKKLNDPNTQISNLDLNNDGEVDYLRVMETADGNVHTISIQSVIAKDQYQEVATIIVEKDTKGATEVQVVGNVDMYGPNYYITPVYPVIPVFFTLFWVAAYRPWYSPWYWGYHPPYFRPWRPYPAYRYRSNVHVHINVHNSYRRTNVSINNRVNVNNTRNNAYFKNNPDKSFNKRNPSVSNRDQLTKDRKATGTNNRVANNRAKKDYKSTGRPVNKTTTKPVNKAVARPSTSKPTSRPTSKPTSRPTTRPTSQPASRPQSRPSTQNTTRPTSRPSNRSSYSRPSSGAHRPSSRQAPSRSSVRRTRH